MSIITKNLTYFYSKDGPYEKIALDDVNVEIKDGEFVGIIGHTGSGKSTLVQHFNGLLKPESGTVFVDGVDVFNKKTDIKSLRKKVGIVFQYPEYQLFEETVYKDIAYGLKNFGIKDAEIESRVKETAGLVGISNEMLEQSPFELSGGEKRRIAIAGVLVMEPQILILDEPAAGLDPIGRKQIFDLLKTIHIKKKITVILVSHSMDDISVYADRILVMDKGKVVMFDEPSKIFKRSSELINIGLDIPQISKVMNHIRELGFDVPYDVFSVEDAKETIIKLIK